MMTLGYTQQAHKMELSGNRASEDDTIEDDEKPEKIVENFDGSTMQDSASRHEQEERWSVGHATVASQADLARPGSVARESTSDRDGQVSESLIFSQFQTNFSLPGHPSALHSSHTSRCQKADGH
jgi:hypothetical protein